MSGLSTSEAIGTARAHPSPGSDQDTRVSVAATTHGLQISDGEAVTELPFAGLSAQVTHTTITFSMPAHSAGTLLTLDFSSAPEGPRMPAWLEGGTGHYLDAAEHGMRDVLVTLERNNVPTSLVGVASWQSGATFAVILGCACLIGMCEFVLAAGGAEALGTVVGDGDAGGTRRVATGVVGVAALGAGLLALPVAATIRYLLQRRSTVDVFDDLTWHTDRPWMPVLAAWLPVVAPLMELRPGRVAVIPLLRPWWRLAGLAVGIAILAAGAALSLDGTGFVTGMIRLTGAALIGFAIVYAYVRPGADPVEVDEPTGRRLQRVRAALLVTFWVGGILAFALWYA